MAEEDLKNELTKLTKELKKQNSFGRQFIHGVLRGLGYAVGFTVVAGIVFWVVARSVDIFDRIPGLDQLIQEEKIINTLEKNNE